jgi:PD-(D/E)XK endonuclease
VAELAFAAEAARLGLSVYVPLTEHGRCDLVVGIGGRLLRVQCKWANRKATLCSSISLRAAEHEMVTCEPAVQLTRLTPSGFIAMT